MRSLADIRAKTPKHELFRGQFQHMIMAVLMTVGACSMLRATGGRFLGLSAMDWAYASIAMGLFNQIMVAIIFRTQLHLNIMVRLFGQNALKVWGAMFLPFLAGRPLVLLGAGLADPGTLGGDRTLQLIIGTILVIPGIWTMHSVLKYFTINRALGGDHFFDEYLNMPIVDQGAFRYSSNAMYSFVFTGLWGVAILTGSWNAAVLALFYHAYIWVHMYCTERPDMDILYRET